MKYFLFAFNNYNSGCECCGPVYPGGGINDLKGVFNSAEDAKGATIGMYFEEFQIMDSEGNKVQEFSKSIRY